MAKKITNAQALKLLGDARSVVTHAVMDHYDIGRRLYEIREEEAWEVSFDSFGEFLKDLDSSPSFFSSLITIHKKIVLECKPTPSQLAQLRWNKARALLRVVTPNNFNHWFNRTRTMSVTETEREVNKACNNPKSLREQIVYYFKTSDARFIKSYLEKIRNANGLTTLSDAMVEAMRCAISGIKVKY